MNKKVINQSTPSRQGSSLPALFYKGNRFVLTPPTKAIPFYTIKSISVLRGPLLEIPGTYNGIPIRHVNLLNVSYLSHREEIQEIILPNEIRKLETEPDPSSYYYHVIHTSKANSLIRPIVTLDPSLPALKAITPSKNHHYFESVDGILYSKDKKKLLLCPWGNGLKEFQVPEGTTQIGKYAFLGHQTLNAVHFPSTLTTVETGAFSLCTSLAKASFRDSSRLSLIKSYAFLYCPITNISFPRVPFSLGDNAFLARSHGHVVLPSTVQEIGDSALAGMDVVTIVEGSAKGVFRAFETATVEVLPGDDKEKGFTFRIPNHFPSWMKEQLSDAWDQGEPLLPILDTFAEHLDITDMDAFTIPLFLQFPDRRILPKIWEQVRANAFFVAATFFWRKDTKGFQAFLNTGILPPQDAALLLPDVNDLGLTDFAAYLLEYCKGSDTKGKSTFAL